MSVLFHILSHHSLVISSEDDLFSYISSRLRSDPDHMDLFQFIGFEYLSAEFVSHFLSVLPDSIDRRLWESISRRLISEISPGSHSKSLKEVEFPLADAKSCDGIIAYLTRKHGGHVQEKGIVTITSKSALNNGPWWMVRNVADLTSGLAFWSKDESCQWVCWDFHEGRVRPTHSTIKRTHLKSWVIEGLLDGVAWTEIDRRANNMDFYHGPFKASFTVSDSTECHFIRLTQTGKNHIGADRLVIHAFEFFGTILE